MKVKVGELKTHLSRYLRQLKDSDETIEVCVREQPVAYLTAAKGAATRHPDEQAALQRALAEVGLTLTRGGIPDAAADGFVPSPVPAGDKRTDLETVRQMRDQKDY
jgi:antitoxin (DNA-binding transcriptional repressor) of toxin-antitoxin stability system